MSDIRTPEELCDPYFPHGMTPEAQERFFALYHLLRLARLEHRFAQSQAWSFTMFANFIRTNDRLAILDHAAWGEIEWSIATRPAAEVKR